MRLLFCLLALFLLGSCDSENKQPDTSRVDITLKIDRFEKELFELDSSRFPRALDSLLGRYPGFSRDFMIDILGASPLWNGDSASLYLQGFIQAYRPIYDSSKLIFKDEGFFEKELLTPLKIFKLHFPDYKLPERIITYIGPLDGYGDVLTENAYLIGIHQHLGKNFSLYSQTWLNDTYPVYITERFEPATISVNCMKNLILDLYPDSSMEQKLMVQMVEQGKRLYLLSLMLPEKKEHLLIGYSEKQIQDCYQFEKNIWNLFIQNNFLQTLDVNIIKNYIGEAPKTQELGESAPGNIGSFAGWQIVKKFMKMNPDLSPKELMAMDCEEIFEKAKYKP
jgi:hypothetical protein